MHKPAFVHCMLYMWHATNLDSNQILLIFKISDVVLPYQTGN